LAAELAAESAEGMNGQQHWGQQTPLFNGFHPFTNDHVDLHNGHVDLHKRSYGFTQWSCGFCKVVL
jgi:hypothetical protein